jgi:hypothetical protein
MALRENEELINKLETAYNRMRKEKPVLTAYPRIEIKKGRDVSDLL